MASPSWSAIWWTRYDIHNSHIVFLDRWSHIETYRLADHYMHRPWCDYNRGKDLPPCTFTTHNFVNKTKQDWIALSTMDLHGCAIIYMSWRNLHLSDLNSRVKPTTTTKTSEPWCCELSKVPWEQLLCITVASHSLGNHKWLYWTRSTTPTSLTMCGGTYVANGMVNMCDIIGLSPKDCKLTYLRYNDIESLQINW